MVEGNPRHPLAGERDSYSFKDYLPLVRYWNLAGLLSTRLCSVGVVEDAGQRLTAEARSALDDARAAVAQADELDFARRPDTLALRDALRALTQAVEAVAERDG